MPVARLPIARMVWRIRGEQRQGLRSALLLQQAGGQVQPRCGIARIIRQDLPEDSLGPLPVPADPQEGGEIGDRGWVARRRRQRPLHRALGRLDLAQPIAGDAVIHPGVGPVGSQRDRRTKCLPRFRGPAQRQPGLAVCVVGFLPLRVFVASLAGRVQGGSHVATGQAVDGQVKGTIATIGRG